MVFTYDYARPALAADIAVFALDDLELQVMLIQRGHEPFVGQWALPGGFVDPGESLEDAARRELKEETGISEVFLEQLYTYGKVDRDPRERVVSVAYYALGNLEGHRVKASTDADEAGWFSLNDLPPLAFDHAEILNDALKRLRAKVRYQPLGFELLPDKFPLRVLQHLYEIVLDRKLDKRNFRKKILSMGILEELDEIEKDVSHRAAKLYRFNPEEYERKTQHGFSFEI